MSLSKSSHGLSCNTKWFKLQKLICRFAHKLLHQSDSFLLPALTVPVLSSSSASRLCALSDPTHPAHTAAHDQCDDYRMTSFRCVKQGGGHKGKKVLRVANTTVWLFQSLKSAWEKRVTFSADRSDWRLYFKSQVYFRNIKIFNKWKNT